MPSSAEKPLSASGWKAELSKQGEGGKHHRALTQQREGNVRGEAYACVHSPCMQYGLRTGHRRQDPRAAPDRLGLH